MENLFWSLFVDTGDIHYYLQYKGVKDVTDEECQQHNHYEVKDAILR